MPHGGAANNDPGSLGEKPNASFRVFRGNGLDRCRPGPYVRGCVTADLVNRRAGSGSQPRVIVLDADPKITAEEHTPAARRGRSSCQVRWVAGRRSLADVHFGKRRGME